MKEFSFPQSAAANQIEEKKKSIHPQSKGFFGFSKNSKSKIAALSKEEKQKKESKMK